MRPHHHLHHAARIHTTEGISDAHAISIYPTPILSAATVEYSLHESSLVNIELYNMLGSKVYDLGPLTESEGQHTQLINTSALEKGFYLLKININEETYLKKVAILN